MKKFTWAFVSLIILSPIQAIADGFNIEEEGLKQVPKSVESIIRKENANCGLIGKPIDLSGYGKRAEFAVTTVAGCDHGTIAGPVWIVKNGKIILSTASYDVTSLRKKSKGLSDLRLFKGSAGYASIQFWSFTGNSYKLKRSYVFTSDDKKTCLAHKAICPYDFD